MNCANKYNTCDDHSDATFPLNTKCSQEHYIQELCKESCETKTDNCDACTNPSYFKCNIDNVPSCIHPELVCDGHAACDNAEDEDLDNPELECFKKLTKLGNIKPEATVRCISKMYADKKMETIAVACDGDEKCYDGVDESWLCTNQSMIVQGSLLILSLLLLGLIFYKLYKGSFGEIMEDQEVLTLLDILNSRIFNQNHDKPEFRDEINLFIQKSKALDSKSTRIAKNKKLYKLESSFHGGNVAQTRLCLKNTLDWSNAKILLEDAFPGLV